MIIILVLAVAAVIGYWLVSPLFIDKEVRENIKDIMPVSATPPDLEEATAPNILKSGSFVGADNFHKAEGTAKLLKAGNKYYIRFEDDFKVTNGPDLFVYFGNNGKYAAETKIGRLKGNIGSQNYEVPENINPLDYNEVWVWCRAFSVAFGHAPL